MHHVTDHTALRRDIATSRTVAIADDDPDMRLLLRLVFARSEYSVVGEDEDGPAALARVMGLPVPPTAVVLDHVMPTMTGLDVAERLLSTFPSLPIVLLSAHVDDELVERARAVGIAACVGKSSCTTLPELLDDVLSRTPG